jgi:hypothetical protein
MGGNFRLPPVAPAADRARRLWIGGELRGRAISRSLSLKAWAGRVAAQIGFVAVPGEEGLRPRRRPSLSRRARERTTASPVVAKMVSKSRRSARFTGRGSRIGVGMM